MNNIAKYRGQANISQKDFAVQLGMTRPGLSFVENGNAKNIKHTKLLKMSEILGVSPIKLLGIENLKYIPESKEDFDYLIELLKEQKEKL